MGLWAEAQRLGFLEHSVALGGDGVRAETVAHQTAVAGVEQPEDAPAGIEVEIGVTTRYPCPDPKHLGDRKTV